MGLSTADEYRESLRDGRTLWYQGRRIPDILAEPDLRVAVDHAALDYAVGHDPRYRDLAVAKDPASGAEFSAYYAIPRCSDDLLAPIPADRDGHRARRHDGHTGEGDRIRRAVRALRVLEGEKRERVLAFYEHCRDGDLSVAVAQTDVKGDRSLPPHAQADPDLYVHVVEERSDGIVVRGAKCHTSIAANAHEIVVLPTRAMGPDDADYAVCVRGPGRHAGPVPLRVRVRRAGTRRVRVSDLVEAQDARDPDRVRRRVRALGTGVPLPGARARRAGRDSRSSSTIGSPRCRTSCRCSTPSWAAAALIAEMNGVAQAGHIREKLTQLVIYAETVRALTEMAGIRARGGRHRHRLSGPAHDQPGQVHVRHRLPRALELVQDCAGGLLVTGPGGADWANPEVRAVLEKFYCRQGPGGGSAAGDAT